MKRIALTLALALSGMAHADTLGFHLGSHHFPARQFNNLNVLPKIERGGSTVVHFMWEKKL